MKENEKIIRARFIGGRGFKTDPAYQHDTGHLLQVSGVTLPERFDVEFTNDFDKVEDTLRDCSGDTFPIPDQFFATGQTVYIWICTRSESTFFTQHEIRIQVIPRAKIPNR